MYADVHIYIYTYTYTYIHTYIYIYNVGFRVCYSMLIATLFDVPRQAYPHDSGPHNM